MSKNYFKEIQDLSDMSDNSQNEYNGSKQLEQGDTILEIIDNDECKVREDDQENNAKQNLPK